MKRLNNLIQLLAMLVAGYAVYDQLQRPPEARTWHGTVFDIFPYDFRVPTMERVKERMWAPDDPEIVKPTVFGVGWTVNAGAIYRMAQNYEAGTAKEA